MFVETKEGGEVQQDPAKVLKLSEAMRIGAQLRPQGFMNWFQDGASCAIGAAYEVVTGRIDYDSEDAPEDVEVFPQLEDLVEEDAMSLQEKIWELNDTEGWSREQIADWLESRGY